MDKTLFCFICKKPIEVKDSKAIAKLCSEHDTESTRQKMLNTPTKELLHIQNEGLQEFLRNMKTPTELNIEGVLKVLEDLKTKAEELPKPTSSPIVGKVNEYGEIIQ